MQTLGRGLDVESRAKAKVRCTGHMRCRALTRASAGRELLHKVGMRPPRRRGARLSGGPPRASGGAVIGQPAPQPHPPTRASTLAATAHRTIAPTTSRRRMRPSLRTQPRMQARTRQKIPPPHHHSAVTAARDAVRAGRLRRTSPWQRVPSGLDGGAARRLHRQLAERRSDALLIHVHHEPAAQHLVQHEMCLHARTPCVMPF